MDKNLFNFLCFAHCSSVEYIYHAVTLYTFVFKAKEYNVIFIISYVKAVEYPAHRTYTHRGLEDLRTMIKKNGRPSSSGVPRIAIVVTDGKYVDFIAHTHIIHQ